MLGMLIIILRSFSVRGLDERAVYQYSISWNCSVHLVADMELVASIF